MDTNRKALRTKARKDSDDSEESVFEESHVVEAQLKNLLERNKREFRGPKKLFEDVEIEIPKLRRSIVRRAMQKKDVISSTPMPSQRTGDFFDTDTSLNISPIEAQCESENGQNNEQIPSCHGGVEGKENQEPKVILTRLSNAIVISDSSSEEETDNKASVSNQVKSKGNSTITKSRYNLRVPKKKEIINQEPQKEANTIVGLLTIPSSSSKHHVQNEEKETNVNQSSRVKDKSNVTRRKSRKELLVNRKRMDEIYKKSPRNKSENRSELELNKTESLNSVRNSKSKNKYSRDRSEETDDRELDFPPNRIGNEDQCQMEANAKDAKSANRVKNSKSQIELSGQNKHEKSNRDMSEFSEIMSPQHTRRNRSQSRLRSDRNTQSNHVEKDVQNGEPSAMKSLIAEICDKKNQTRSAEKSGHKTTIHSILDSLKKNSRSDGDMTSKNADLINPVSSLRKSVSPNKNNVAGNVSEPCERKITVRKLSFSQDHFEKGSTSAGDVPKHVAKKLSRIPLFRANSRSQEQPVKRRSTHRSTSKEIVQRSEHRHSINDHVSPTKSPPKRPPRRKKISKRRNNTPKSNLIDPAIAGNSSLSRELPKSRVTALDKTLTESKPVDDIDDKTLTHPHTPPSKLNLLDADVNTSLTLVTKKSVQVGTSRSSFESDKVTPARQTAQTCTSSSERIRSQKREQNKTIANVIMPPTPFANKTIATTKRIEAVDVGTSPLHSVFSADKEMLTDERAKLEKLNQLIARMTQKNLKPSNSFGACGSDKSNSSRISSMTDQSEILKELDKEKCDNMLFQSLIDGFLPPSFSSSDDEVMHINQRSLPWRLDDNVIAVPRRSSYKLNFLRSAREIEVNRQSLTNPYENCRSSDSDSERDNVESRKGVKRDPNSLGVLAHTRRKVYSRVTERKVKENTRNTRRAGSESPVDEGRASSLSNFSPLLLSEPELDHRQQRTEQPIDKNLNEENKDKSTEESNERNSQLYNQKTDNRAVAGDISNLTPSPITEIEIDKCAENVIGGRTNSSANKRVSRIKTDDENEILAVPLDDINVAEFVENRKNSEALSEDGVSHSFQKERSDQKSKSQRISKNKTKNDESQNNDAALLDNGMPYLDQENKCPEDGTDPVNSTERRLPVKIPKVRERKSRKKRVTENYDAVSSTSDSNEAGIRRSGRERRPAPRRCLGVIVASTERVLRFYNGSSIPVITEEVTISSRPRTKNNTAKEKQKNKTNDNKEQPAVKRSRRGRPTKNRDKETKSTSGDYQVNTDTIDYATGDINNGAVSRSRTEVYTNDNTTRTTGNAARGEETTVRKSNRKASESKISLKTGGRSSRRRKRLSYSSGSCYKSVIISENHADLSENVDVDNNYVPDEDDNAKHLSNDPLVQQNENTIDFAGPSNVPKIVNTEERLLIYKSLDKDSGRSTMLKSTLSEDSCRRVSKRLAGRIGKNCKKKNTVSKKISKMFSRSINNSNEFELFDGQEHVMAESVSAIPAPQNARLTRSSAMQIKPTDGEYIELLSNDNVAPLRYVDKIANFKSADGTPNAMMLDDRLKNLNGVTMGHLKLLPGCQKSLHIARKFDLCYFVMEGEGFIQVQNRTSRVGKYSKFLVPLGVEYSVNNISKEDSLVLGYVKIPPANVES